LLTVLFNTSVPADHISVHMEKHRFPLLITFIFFISKDPKASETSFLISWLHSLHLLLWQILCFMINVTVVFLIFWRNRQINLFDVCVTVHHWYNNINNQLDATITNFIDNYNQLNMFRATVSPILSLWYNAPTMQPAGTNKICYCCI
jgi:hypothetical protein